MICCVVLTVTDRQADRQTHKQKTDRDIQTDRSNYRNGIAGLSAPNAEPCRGDFHKKDRRNLAERCYDCQHPPCAKCGDRHKVPKLVGPRVVNWLCPKCMKKK